MSDKLITALDFLAKVGAICTIFAEAGKRAIVLCKD